MYRNITEKCKEAIGRSSRTFSAFIAYGEKIYKNIKSVKISALSAADGQIGIGTTASSRIEIIMSASGLFVSGGKIELYISPQLDSGAYENIPMGTFWITESKEKNGLITLSGGGALSVRAEQAYFSKLAYPADAKDVLKEISGITDITINADSLQAKTIQSKPIGYTCREVIGYIAGIYGKFAVEQRDGSIAFKWYEAVAEDIFTDRMDFPELSQNNFILEKLACSVSNDITYTRGSGMAGVSISNPFMTEKDMDEIWQEIGGYAYRPGNVSIKLGDPCIDAWDSYMLGSLNIICAKIEFSYDGGLQCVISSKGKSDAEANYKGPVVRYMERTATDMAIMKVAIAEKLTADEADIRYLQADKINAIEADVEKAVIGSLSSEFVTADYLKANYITAERVKSQYAEISLANVEKATIGTVLADVGLITDTTIVDGHVTGFLDSVNINANSITAGDLSVERLIIRGSDKSLVYALNNITGALQAKNVDTLNGEVLTKRTVTADRLVAKSITANEIAAGTINANNLNVANIFADSTVLNTLTAQAAFINAISTNSVVVGAGNAANSALREINNLQIGAKNLLRYSGQFTNTTNGYWIDNGGGITFDASEKYNGYNTIKTTVGSGIAGQWHKLDNNTEYTYSVMLKSNAAFNGTKSTPIHYWAGKDNVNQSKISIIKYDTVYPTANKWKLLYITFKLTGDANSFRPFVYTSAFKNVFHIAYLKLEKGNRATDWTPAPEDVESSISDAQLAADRANGAIANWCYNNNATYINGGKIYTGTITANAIASKAITASKINVASLSAISANLGTITAGIIKSTNYVANSTGMQLNLANGVWDSKNFKISSSGEVSIVGALETKEGNTDKAVVDQNGLSIYGSTGYLGRFSEINLSKGGEGLLVGAQPAAKAIWFGVSTAADPKSYSPKMVINNGYNMNGFTEDVIIYNTLRAVTSITVAGNANYKSILTPSKLQVYNTSNGISSIYGSELCNTLDLEVARKASIGGATSSYALTSSSFLCASWIRTTGNTGWFNETYGGGINMTDSTWIRTYGNKQFYCNKLIQSPQIKATDSLTCNGGVELYHATPHIDFHFGNSSADYTSRIIEYSSGKLTVHNSIANASDARLKKDIQDLPPIYVDILDNLRPKQYRFIKGDKYLNLGFVAQEVEETLKEFGIMDMPLISKENGTYALDYNGIMAMLVLGYQSLKKDFKKVLGGQNHVKDFKKY